MKTINLLKNDESLGTVYARVILKPKKITQKFCVYQY